ncbi:Rab proteins geranylgeranyltransferase component A 1 [Trichuris trichiura]|uniref:Rab proteins geranylgeranyltransferase component A 1 n=1 Tax=Trichuris trichiura TaxID=36087 RepID=A0A077Z6E7_TRITR|nr:Rab proteins geranylgeranyltransferase component A 1 [Trichuris trichiura]
MELKDYALPDAVDVVVLGTGLPECILAAACARVGLSVLHLDKNEYYGGFWASFTFEQMQQWVKNHQDMIVQNSEVSSPSSSVMNNEVEFRIEDDCWNLVPGAKGMLITAFICIDKVDYVQLIFAGGTSTDILIRSGVSQYVEFKSVDRVLTTCNENNIRSKVPLSRSQVFQSKEIDLTDKRLLMRLLLLCWDYEMNAFKAVVDYETKYLYSIKLQFFRTVKKIMKSSGTFGCQTSFLWPMYGCGDLAQAFSRSCAVFGGVYCLRCPVEAWLTDEKSGNVGAIVAQGKRIDCKYLVSSVEYIPRKLRQKLILSDDESFCRAILLTNSSLIPDTKSHVSFVQRKPRVLWSVFYNHLPDLVERSTCGNVIVTTPPGSEWDMDSIIEKVT